MTRDEGKRALNQSFRNVFDDLEHDMSQTLQSARRPQSTIGLATSQRLDEASMMKDCEVHRPMTQAEVVMACIDSGETLAAEVEALRDRLLGHRVETGTVNSGSKPSDPIVASAMMRYHRR